MANSRNSDPSNFTGDTGSAALDQTHLETGTDPRTSETTDVAIQSAEELDSPHRNLSSRTNSKDRPALIGVILLAISLPFGAVHAIPYAIAVLGVSVLSLWLLWEWTSGRTQLLEPRGLAFCFGLTLILAYALVQASFLSLGAEHPLGSSFERSTLQEFFNSFLPGFTLFIGTFLVATSFLLPHPSAQGSNARGSRRRRRSSKNRRANSSLLFARSDRNHFATKAEMALLITGVIMSLIALSHWLSDSGKLFWIFAPVFDAPTNRARWPFVNPNHLGFFLLPCFFVSLSVLAKRFLGIFGVYYQLQDRNQARERFAEVLGKQEVQRELGVFGISILTSLTILITLIATLSRACWMGLCLGLFVLAPLFFLAFSSHEEKLHRIIRRRRKNPNRSAAPEDLEGSAVSAFHTGNIDTHEENLDRQEYQQRKGKLTVRSRALSFSLACSVAIVALLVSVSLLGAGEGIERIENRFLYGLVSSQEDMRWQLFVDSVPMLSTFGIGFGRWNEAYQAILSEGMAGVHPRYLHSEPLQFAIELGFVGLALGLILFLYPLLLLVRSLKNLYEESSSTVYPEEVKSQLYSRLTVSSLIGCWVAVGIALFFDFHLRVPANLALLAVLCAFSIRAVEHVGASRE